MKILNRVICIIAALVVTFVLCYDKLDGFREMVDELLSDNNVPVLTDGGDVLSAYGLDGFSLPGDVEIYDSGKSYIVFGNIQPKDYLDFVWSAYQTLGRNNGNVYDSGEELRDEYYPAVWNYSLLNEVKNTFVYKLNGEGPAYMISIRYYPAENDRYARGAVQLRLYELGNIRTVRSATDISSRLFYLEAH
jgi:hypothetical protein